MWRSLFTSRTYNRADEEKTSFEANQISITPPRPDPKEFLFKWPPNFEIDIKYQNNLPKFLDEEKPINANEYLPIVFIRILEYVDWKDRKNRYAFGNYIRRIYYYRKLNCSFQISYKFCQINNFFLRIYLENIQCNGPIPENPPPGVEFDDVSTSFLLRRVCFLLLIILFVN